MDEIGIAPGGGCIPIFFKTFFFAEGEFFFAFLEGNGLFWEVVVGKIDFLNIFGRFVPIFRHFYFFGAFSFCTMGAFLAIFPIFLGFVGIFWGTPRIISPIFGQF